jgi:hypothetical protein
VYSFGLLGMLAASGLDHSARPGRLKAVLRSFDDAMIFVMIASYTPLALNALSSAVGRPLCAVVWVFAGLGIALKLGRPHLYEMLSLALYLSLGWLGIAILPRLLAVLPSEVLALLLSGGAELAGAHANRHRAAKLARCRELLAQPPPKPIPERTWQDRLRELAGQDIDLCPAAAARC